MNNPVAAFYAEVEAVQVASRPLVRVNDRFLREVVADAVAALAAANEPPTVFLRGNRLVWVPPAESHAEPLGVPTLRVLLDRAADFVKASVNDEGQGRHQPARPPVDVCESILAMPPQGAFPQLVGIRSAPVFLPDGRLLAREGYDAGSGLLLRLQGLESVRDDMPVADVLALLRDELLGDFPFADESGLPHALALLVEPFVRPMIAGPTPLYLIDAPVRGAGKGLLASACCLVATGRRADVMALARSDTEEHEKRITALLLAGAQWVLLDNVDAITSAPLAAVLTATRWRGRRLGKSEMVDVPNDATWVATGNNVQLSDEIARRTIPIRLDPGVERPEERTNFRHPDLLAWAAAHRAELVSACLSLVRAWLNAGRPEGEKTLGSYEAWARILGGILGVAGVSGFLGARERLYAEADRETAEWRAMCAAWWETYGSHPVTAKDIFAVAKERGLLLDLWGGRTELAAHQRFGHALAKLRDRIFGCYRICPAGRDGTTRNLVYRLELAPTRATGRGEVQTPETPERPEEGPLSPAAQGFSGDGLPGVSAQNTRQNTRSPAKTPGPPAKTPGVPEAEKPRRTGVSGSAPRVSGVSGVLNPPHGSVDADGEREVVGL